MSAVTGEGIEQLLAALASAVPSDPPDGGRPRLWVDRSFSAAGAGTIVTGSLHGGSLATEDTVEIHPGGRQARLRGIQTHERDTDSVAPGRRVALNLAGVSADEVGRGDMVGLPGQWRTTRRFVATLNTARFVDELDQRGAYQLHIGSAAHQVVITGIEAGRAVLTLHDEIPAAVGDRYILRDTGRHLVVAGGRVLDPAPGRTMRALASVSGLDPDADPDDIATLLLAIRSLGAARPARRPQRRWPGASTPWSSGTTSSIGPSSRISSIGRVPSSTTSMPATRCGRVSRWRLWPSVSTWRSRSPRHSPIWDRIWSG